MINKIVGLINLKSNTEIILNSSINLAIHLNLSVEIYCFIEGPLNWNVLSRSSKVKHSKTKKEIALAKELMDGMLQKMRSKGIKALKVIHLTDLTKPADKLYYSRDNLVIATAAHYAKCNSEPKNFGTCFPKNSPLLILQEDFHLGMLNDAVVMSTFKNGLDPLSAYALNLFSNYIEFHTHFLLLNTYDQFESTNVSVEKMKKAIRSSCLGKTHMDVYNATDVSSGLVEYVKLKSCDLILIENYALDTILGESKIDTAILFIPCHLV